MLESSQYKNYKTNNKKATINSWVYQNRDLPSLKSHQLKTYLNFAFLSRYSYIKTKIFLQVMMCNKLEIILITYIRENKMVLVDIYLRKKERYYRACLHR